MPLEVLRAITRTETGRGGKSGLEPWPWTVNMEGAGKWFETEAEAKAYVEKHFQRGARSFDVGCFQINYRWHHQAFESLNDMFDPVTNARYAAKFLQDLHGEFGSWTKAAGAFHSRTPKYADRYVARFTRIRDDLTPMTAVASLPERRVTTFSAPRPLVAGRRTTALISAPSGATSAALGSLVPLSGGSGQALIAIR
ncbi:transglycosylase SLT domain-containing protein [Tritonibacter multivorans]|uniref:transglycosylase SLT domain-containing protein n=1 Tax=Tritonibacter multivorans TaxID=928856 RepID=UPI002E270AD6